MIQILQNFKLQISNENIEINNILKDFQEKFAIIYSKIKMQEYGLLINKIDINYAINKKHVQKFLLEELAKLMSTDPNKFENTELDNEMFYLKTNNLRYLPNYYSEIINSKYNCFVHFEEYLLKKYDKVK